MTDIFLSFRKKIKIAFNFHYNIFHYTENMKTITYRRI